MQKQFVLNIYQKSAQCNATTTKKQLIKIDDLQYSI